MRAGPAIGDVAQNRAGLRGAGRAPGLHAALQLDEGKLHVDGGGQLGI